MYNVHTYILEVETERGRGFLVKRREEKRRSDQINRSIDQ